MERGSRVLNLFVRLLRRERLSKESLVEEYKADGRTIARDIHAIRIALSDLHEQDELLYDRKDKCYYLSRGGQHDFSGMDVMALLKVLLGSRALRRDEMIGLVDAIRSLLPYEDRIALYYAIEDELKNYIEPMHGKAILELQWRINKSIINRAKKYRLFDMFQWQDLFFTSTFGCPINATNFNRRYFTPLLKRCNIPQGFTFHGFAGYAASSGIGVVETFPMIGISGAIPVVPMCS